MARTTTQGQSYPLLSLVKDEGTREVFRVLMDQINQLRQPAAAQDLGGNTFTNMADPTSITQPVTLGYLQTNYSPAVIRQALLSAGSSPLDITGLRGQASQVQRAKIRVNPAGTPLTFIGQPFELLYDEDTPGLFYFNASTAAWVAI